MGDIFNYSSFVKILCQRARRQNSLKSLNKKVFFYFWFVFFVLIVQEAGQSFTESFKEGH